MIMWAAQTNLASMRAAMWRDRLGRDWQALSLRAVHSAWLEEYAWVREFSHSRAVVRACFVSGRVEAAAPRCKEKLACVHLGNAAESHATAETAGRMPCWPPAYGAAHCAGRPKIAGDHSRSAWASELMPFSKASAKQYYETQESWSDRAEWRLTYNRKSHSLEFRPLQLWISCNFASGSTGSSNRHQRNSKS